MTFVHPFDDEVVIAGQGTMGLEILQQVPDIEAVIAPIGGGEGLIAGVARATTRNESAGASDWRSAGAFAVYESGDCRGPSRDAKPGAYNRRWHRGAARGGKDAAADPEIRR